MKKIIKKLSCSVLCAGIVFSLASCAAKEADINGVFKNSSKISYSTTYKELSPSKTNSTSAWRQGMVSGNGLQGYITSGAPYSDTFIFQNMHFIMPNKNVRYCPDTSDELETVKQNIVKGENIIDDASYDDVYYYHPGGSLRISSEKNRVKDYIRYTDYETAETGVRFTDKFGNWERKSFTSKADDVSVIKIGKSSQNSKVNVMLSFDDISSFANYGDGNEKDIKYKKIVSDDLSTIAMAAHYPDYENSELKNGGFATLTYIICENGSKEKIIGNPTEDEQYAGEENPQIKITDADAVYLITVSDRTYDIGSIQEFEKQNDWQLTADLKNKAESIALKYSAEAGFDYDAALNAHLAVYQPQFNSVTIQLENGDSGKANDYLLKKQRGNSQILSELAQRTYYSGRYAYLCCSGYSTSRLYGMWTGEWNTGWGSKYTMDANVNLQTSSMNTGNMPSSPVGYTYFILRQLPDWEENALATHGYTNAIQAPVNTDGDKAVITETCYPYPFRYWNAGTSWMLQPLFETLQCYGNLQIPLSDEFDLNRLKSVLSLTEEDLTDDDISAIKEKGYLDFEREILLPLLIKSANYWQQMLTPDYYTDADGNIHYESGKTALADNEYYCILPSYSPENNPENYPSPSAANTAIDIAACRHNMQMLLQVIDDLDADIDTSQWQYIMDKLPPYLYDETGALKEWACNQFEENNEHRHLSHLYGVWPLDETQNDEALRKACIQAIENRESENEASHALVHRSLIAARLKDRNSLTDALNKLMNHRIHYNSLMTNHDYDRGSCYCTDFAIGYLGIINESLLYSDSGVIEILPALPESGFSSGTVTGLRAKTRAEISELVWDTETGTAYAVIYSDIDQKITVSCGLSDEEKTYEIKAGESIKAEFSF